MTTLVRPTPSLRLRAKNQLTLPEEVARAIGAKVGDRFFVEADGPDRIVLELIPRSYAGALAGMWGSQEEIDAEIRESRDSWRDE